MCLRDIGKILCSVYSKEISDSADKLSTPFPSNVHCCYKNDVASIGPT